MWRANKDTVYATLAAGVMMIITAECLVWAITGAYIGRCNDDSRHFENQAGIGAKAINVFRGIKTGACFQRYGGAH